MRLWPFARRAIRSPQAAAGTPNATPSNYTDYAIAALTAAAAGGVLDPDRLAAAEFAASLVSRCMAMATVEAPPRLAAAITRQWLSIQGRDLIARGEAVSLIDVEPSGVMLLPAASWDLRGGYRPRTWVYRLDAFGPTGNRTRLVPAAGVIHVKHNVSGFRPYSGQPSAHLASATAGTATGSERSLGRENKVPVTRIVVAAHPSADERAVFEAKLAAGGLTSVAGGSFPVGDRGAEPSAHWRPAKMGPEPPAALVELRRDSIRELVSALGVPPELFSGGTEGSQRAGWRRFLTGTLAPLAELLADELTMKLEAQTRLDLAALVAPDAAVSAARAVGSRANAYAVLVGTGMSDAEARELSGL